MGKLATCKWFTDNYTRGYWNGSWEPGVSDTIFKASRSNVYSSSNKVINYNDLLNPEVYYTYDGNSFGATTNKCLEQTDITNLMRPTNFTVDITRKINSNNSVSIYFINTDFDSTAAAISDNYPIKIEVDINNYVYKVNVSYQSISDGYGVINHSGTTSVNNSIIITKVSVYRPNAMAQYIVKPQITFNHSSGLSIGISGQAEKFATVGSVIANYVPDGAGGDNTGGDNTGGDNTGGDNTGGNTGGNTGSGTPLVIQSHWYSVYDYLYEVLQNPNYGEIFTNYYSVYGKVVSSGDIESEYGQQLIILDSSDSNSCKDAVRKLVGKYVVLYGKPEAKHYSPTFIALEIIASGDYLV